MHISRILVALVLVGWLAGGTCHVSYCDEDCDPCVQRCHCRTSVCYRSSATWIATHTLASYERFEEVASVGALHRRFADVRGLSVELAGGPPRPDAREVLAFARDVLLANPELFGRDGGAFSPLDVERFEDGYLVRFQRDENARTVEIVTFLFDRRGNLVEVAHDRRP